MEWEGNGKGREWDGCSDCCPPLSSRILSLIAYCAILGIFPLFLLARATFTNSRDFLSPTTSLPMSFNFFFFWLMLLRTVLLASYSFSLLLLGVFCFSRTPPYFIVVGGSALVLLVHAGRNPTRIDKPRFFENLTRTQAGRATFVEGPVAVRILANHVRIQLQRTPIHTVSSQRLLVKSLSHRHIQSVQIRYT